MKTGRQPIIWAVSSYGNGGAGDLFSGRNWLLNESD